jgi:hypothetical protein
MTAESIVRSSTHSAARISLVLLLTALLVFPDGMAFAQAVTCSAKSTWQPSTVALPNITETLGVALNGSTAYVIGGENWNSGNPLFPTKIYHKLAASLYNGNTTGWYSDNLWQDKNSNPPNQIVGFSRDLCGVVANGYVYTVGGVYQDTGTVSNGHNYGFATNQVWYAKIQSSGSLGTWTLSPYTLPAVVQLHGAVVLNNYLYVIGGSNDPYGDTNVSHNVTNVVSYAQISPTTGAILSAFQPGPTLPGDSENPSGERYKTCPVVDGSTIYIAGGENSGGALYTVYYATQSGGVLGSWTPVSSTSELNILGVDTTDAAQAVVYNNGIILMGGDQTGSGNDTNCVFQGTVTGAGDITWSTTNIISPLPVPISRNAGLTYGKYIFSLGGNHGGKDVSTINWFMLP